MSLFGDEPDWAPLSRQEVEALPSGTPVIIVWSGGNGPHRYTVRRIPGGLVAADSWEDDHEQWDVDGKGLDGPSAFVGTAPMHTRVWRVVATVVAQPAPEPDSTHD